MSVSDLAIEAALVFGWGTLSARLERFAEADGKLVHELGGADLIRQVLAAGLAGELTIIIAPVTLGAGKRLFAGSANPWNSRTSDAPATVRDFHRLPREE